MPASPAPSFGRARRGAVATWFAAALLPLAALAGGAIDMAGLYAARAKLSGAVDAATLATAATPGLDAAQAAAMADTYVRANLGPGAPVHSLVVTTTVTATAVTVQARGAMDTVLLGLVGVPSFVVASEAEAVRETRGLEVAMVLDNTGSMLGNGGMTAMRAAATDLVAILTGGANAHPNLKIGLVPFVTAVNVKTTGFSDAWIDAQARSTHHGENFDLEGGLRVSHLTLFDRLPNADWKGCVEMRAAPYDTQDAPPDPATPDTLFTPYFWPDEPTPGGAGLDYQNNYIANDRVSGTPAQRQRSLAKYGFAATTIDETPSDTMGPNKSCPQPITALTNDRQRLLADIDQMTGWNQSGTNIAAGLYWGWALLSPGEPFDNPTPYGSATTQKALILFTDGENQVWGGWDSHNRSNYSGYGYMAANRLGTTDAGAARAVINGRVATLCQNIKAAGIRVYTITFAVNTTAIRDLFRTCASSPSLYFHSPDAATLRAAFQTIAQDLSRLRLSR